MKYIQLNGQQVQSLLGSGEVVVRRPVRPGRGQNWLRQDMIDQVREVEFDGGEWLVLKHPAGEGNLTCIRNIIGRIGELRAHRTLMMKIIHVSVERAKEWEWVICLRHIEQEAEQLSKGGSMEDAITKDPSDYQKRLEKYITRIRELEAELAAAKEDSARLDWLLPVLSLEDGDGDTRAVSLANQVMRKTLDTTITARAAIDAARKGEENATL